MAPSGDMVKMDQKLRDLLRMARRRAQMTPEQVARRAGVSLSYYYKLEEGKRVNPSIPALLDIFWALSVTTDNLAGIGHHKLASELAEQQRIMGEESPYKDQLERYLYDAPGEGPDGRADLAVRLSLIAFSRTIREMQTAPEDQAEPFAGMYLRTRRG